MLEVYSILSMYCTTSIQLVINIIDLIHKLVCITDLITIDKSDKIVNTVTLRVPHEKRAFKE
jgi:hypothetical protein